jgi:hypothetical protein
VLEGDPLGRFAVTPAAVKERDEMVWEFATSRGLPILQVRAPRCILLC